MLVCYNGRDCWRLIVRITCRKSHICSLQLRLEDVSRYKRERKSGYEIVGGDQGGFVTEIILCRAEVFRNWWIRDDREHRCYLSGISLGAGTTSEMAPK